VADPDMWPDAIEELMRWETPVPVATRTPTMDTQFGDTVVEAGTHVTVLWAAANLDPEKFTDPMTVNLTRRPNPHYSFASGFHRCLGSHLARMELRSALDQFHKRIPEYVITPGGELKYEAMPLRLAPMVGDLLHKVPDLLARDFTAVTPNTTYVGDITYLPLATGSKLVSGHGDRRLLTAGGGMDDR
jgi:hypothetical protein